MSRVILVGLLSLAAASTAQAQSASRFDLQCDITQQMVGGDRDVEPRLSKWRIRIDLARKVWCTNECPRVSDVGEVTSSQIQLLNSREGGIRINRINGSLETPPSRSFGMTWTLSGQCARAPYTPIPQQAF